MNGFVNEEIQEYLNRHYRATVDSTLQELHLKAEKLDFPIVGPEVGNMLLLLARAMQAKNILELGSGFGYSAYWFAQALDYDGLLVCTDFSTQNKEYTQSLLKRIACKATTEYRVGDALQLLEHDTHTYDIIFNDIDKEFYPQVIALARKHLKTGGMLITDNALWRGQVAHASYQDEATQAVRQFNAGLRDAPDFHMVIMPIRDGLSLAMKLY